MKTMKTYRASGPHKLYLLLSVGMIAFLLLGALMTARPAQAAVNELCTTNADGDWANAIWICDGVATTPGLGDDAVVLNEVTISSDQAVHSLSIEQFGILQFTAAVTLTVNGNFSKDANAIFDPGNDWFEPVTGGTVVFGSGDNIITSAGNVIDFYNLSKTASGAGESLRVDPQVAGAGGIHILHSLTLKGADAGTLLSLGSTTPGQQWGVEADWINDVNFVDVQDLEKYWHR